MEEVAPRHIKDLVTNALAETFGDGLFCRTGHRGQPPIVSPLPTVVRAVQLQHWEMHYVFGLATGGSARLEFQDRVRPETRPRFLLYDALGVAPHVP